MTTPTPNAIERLREAGLLPRSVEWYDEMRAVKEPEFAAPPRYEEWYRRSHNIAMASGSAINDLTAALVAEHEVSETYRETGDKALEREYAERAAREEAEALLRECICEQDCGYGFNEDGDCDMHGDPKCERVKAKTADLKRRTGGKA
jgi:hypothetical protein